MIDIGYLKRCLEDLVNTPSPVGMTERATVKVAAWLETLGYPVTYTRRGVLSVTVGDGEPRRALAAHVDTLGAMVTGFHDNGRPRLRNTGTWTARFAEGARCTIFTDDGEVRGTILPLKASGHLFNTEVDTQPSDWDNLEVRIDMMPTDPSTPQTRPFNTINIGDVVAIDAQPEFLDNGFIVSRHLDDKAGVACLLAALKYFADTGTQPAIGGTPDLVSKLRSLSQSTTASQALARRPGTMRPPSHSATEPAPSTCRSRGIFYASLKITA